MYLHKMLEEMQKRTWMLCAGERLQRKDAERCNSLEDEIERYETVCICPSSSNF